MADEIEKMLEPEEVQELMQEYDLDSEQAERAQELIDDGLDEGAAVEIAENE